MFDDDDDIDTGAFLLILGTLAAVIAVVSWWFLTQRPGAGGASAGEIAAPAVDLVADTKAALATDKTDQQIKGLAISLGEPKTVIVLQGDVASQTVKTRAGELAAAVKGVSKVDNQLTVAAAPTTTGAASTTTARAPTTSVITNLSLARVADANPDLSSLVAQLQKAGVADTLPTGVPFTLFAPNNNAFTNIDAALKRATDNNNDRLRRVLTYHVVLGKIAPEALSRQSTPLQTVAGENLTVTPGNPVKLADGRLTVQRSFDFGAGTVYVVDAIAVPPTVATQIQNEERVNQIVRLQPIRFASGSATIQAESFATLDQAATALQAVSGNVEIQGHTDSDGTASGNQQLSEARANAVRDYLVSKGIAANRLTARGYGQDRPVAPNDSDANKALNRRIEFVLS